MQSVFFTYARFCLYKQFTVLIYGSGHFSEFFLFQNFTQKRNFQKYCVNS